MKTLNVLVFLTFLLKVEGANIMLWLPFVFKSAMVAYMPLVEELANRGHKVTVVSSYLKSNVKNPNINQVYTGDFVEEFNKNISAISLQGEEPPLDYFADGFCNHNDQALGRPEVQKAIAKDLKYDMIIVYVDFTCCETGHYLSQRFDAPLVLLSIFQSSWTYLDWAMGQPNNPSYMPLSLLPFKAGEMSFFERLLSTYYMWETLQFRNHILVGRAEKIWGKHFPGESKTTILELEKNASLALSFGHPHLTDGWKPTMPNYVQIGMMLCNPKAGKFEKGEKIKEFLDKGSTMLVSFGSVVKTFTLPKAKLELFLNVFEKLKPLQILLKWEDDSLEGKLPSNVMTSKWLPQQDVLAHANVKLFITHAGQSSMQESICHKTPMVAIPIFGDQRSNGVEIEKMGVGLNLDYNALTEDLLLTTVKKVLNDNSFKEKVAQLSDVLTDEIDKPLDRAVWWLEHVLRHPNLYAGKAAVHKLSWAQYFLLDIIGFVFSIMLVTLIVVYKIVSWMCCQGKRGKTGGKQKRS